MHNRRKHNCIILKDGVNDPGLAFAGKVGVTPDFPKKTKCISYVCQDQVYTHIIDVMSEISINGNKIVQELNHYIIFLLHSDVRLEGLYNDQTITMKT
jgi:hypothetical protein